MANEQAVTTTPFKKSPYKMHGMSWKEGQQPMNNLNGANTKDSPFKELTIAAYLIGTAIVAGVGWLAKNSAASKRARSEHARLTWENKRENKKDDIMAMDKMASGFGSAADRHKSMAAQIMS